MSSRLCILLQLLIATWGCSRAAAFFQPSGATVKRSIPLLLRQPPSPSPPGSPPSRAAYSLTRLFVFERMTEECVNAIVTAQTTATRLMLEAVDEGCMLIGCVDHPESKALERTFQQFRVKYRDVSIALERQVNGPNDDGSSIDGSSSKKWLAGFRAAATNDNDRPFSPALKRRFKGAAKIADQMESSSIGTHHLFLSLLGYKEGSPSSGGSQIPVALADDADDDDDEVSSSSSSDTYEAWRVLRTVVTPQDGTVTALRVCESFLSHWTEQGSKGANRNGGSGPELVTGAGNDASRTPTLSEVGTDLTQLAKDGLLDPVHARDNEIRSCLRTLLRRRKNNVVLLGEPGTGKTAIAEGVAQLLVSDGCPPKLRGHRLVSLELSSLVAGTKYRGEFEERLQSVLEEVLDPKAPPTILFIDEIHNLVGAGSAEGGMDAANLLKPALARGEMQLIGATTISEYRKYIEKDGALERRLQPVMVGEPTVDQTVGILQALRSNYEQHHGVSYTSSALYAAASLSERYISDRFLPDKAIDLVDEAGAVAQLQRGDDVAPSDPPTVDEHMVAKVISEMTGIPIGKLESTEMDRLRSLETELESRVTGQRRAVRAVARAIRRARSGLRDPRRPVASFLLCGGTGTGKTELCKTLAATYYGSEKDMIRIDMSEYMDKHTVSRLVGSPPGFIGYDEGGQLTEKVRKMPHSVVLLDEIDKAHSDVLNILLQVLEDGVLTDGKGRTVSFKNTILVMTSNVGSKRILDLSRVNSSSQSTRESLPVAHVNGGSASIAPEPLNSMTPEEALTRLQNSPLASSLLLKASSDPEIMDAIRSAMSGSPADLLEVAQRNSGVADFLTQLWASLETGDKSGTTSGTSPGLNAIRASVKDVVSNWSDDSKSKFITGVAKEMNSPLDNDDLYPKLAEVVKEELEAKMKPELLNRIDEIVVFSPLRNPELVQIASLTVNRILDRASHEQDLILTVDESIVNEIVREGSANAEQFGARPMRRAAQRFVEDTVSDAVVQGFLCRGDQATLTLSMSGSAAPTKKKVAIMRTRDGQQMIADVEDASGGIDGVNSSSFGRARSSNSDATSEASAVRSQR